MPAPTTMTGRPSRQRHPGLDRDLDDVRAVGGDRASCSASRQLLARRRPAARRRRSPAPPRRRRGAGRSRPGAPATSSIIANHFRIAYSSLRGTRKVTGTLYAAAVQNVWIAYCALPSPTTQTTGRSGWASWTPIDGGHAEAEAAAGGEVVAARPRGAQLVAQRERRWRATRARRCRRRAAPRRAPPWRARRSSGPTPPPARPAGAARGRRAASARRRRRASAAQRERDVGDDRVAHRRPRGLVGVARDRDEPRALGQQRARGCSGSRGRPTSRRRGRGRGRCSVSPSGPIAGGRMPWKSAWSSGKPSRPPPGAGVAHTGSRSFSASATAASQPPLASMSGPGDERAGSSPRRGAARGRATIAGSATARPVDACASSGGATAASSTSASQSSIGIETNTGPFGGSAARWAARASAWGTSSARGGS